MSFWFGPSEEERQKFVKDAFSYNPQNVNGWASFRNDQQIKDAGGFDEGGLITGRSLESGKVVNFHARRCSPHAGVFGSSSSGKSSLIISMLMSMRKSGLIFDPTGELAAVTGAYRGTLGPVCQYNPLAVHCRELAGIANVRINPIGPHFLNPKRPDFDSRARDVASAIVPEIDGHNKFFHDTPQGWLATLEMCVVLYEKPENRNLPFIAREIIRGDIRGYAARIADRTTDRNLLARLRDLVVEPGEEEARSFKECLQTLKTETEFLLNAAVAESLSASDICLRDLLRKRMTLYLELPLNSKSMVKLSKLILGCVSSEMFQEDPDAKEECLIVCEELYQVGKELSLLPRALAASRKFGAHFLLCFTSVSEAKAMWPHEWEGLINNLGLKIWTDATDVAGSEYVSRMLGETEVYASTKNINYPSSWNVDAFCEGLDRAPSVGELRNLKVSQSYQQVKRPLLNPLEVRELRSDLELVISKEFGSLCLKKIPYYEDPVLSKRARPNPFFKPKASGNRAAPKNWRKW